MLRHVLGDSAFFRSLRAYTGDAALRYRTATTDDFRRECELVSGRDLGYFFSEWVYGEGYPRYSLAWSSRRTPSGEVIDALLYQTTTTLNPPFFKMPVDLQVKAPGWDTTIVVFHEFSGQQFTIPVSHHPDSVFIDPNHWILRDLLPPNPALPADYRVDQNYPNPFNPSTSIEFHLPRRSNVSLEVFNILGESVVTLVSGRREAGDYSVAWDGRSDRGVQVPSGVYFYRLSAGQFRATKKMLYLR
jgi:hypothetical protein